MEPLEDRRLLSYTVTNLGSLGGTVSVPVDVNNHGEVVGYSYTANNAVAHAFVFSHGKMKDLGTLGGTTSGATGINDRGVIVGMSNIAPGNSQIDAFREQDGKRTDLGPLNLAFVMAGGVIKINADGVISGISDGDNASIDRRGTDIELGSLAGLGSVAEDLNDQRTGGRRLTDRGAAGCEQFESAHRALSCLPLQPWGDARPRHARRNGFGGHCDQ